MATNLQFNHSCASIFTFCVVTVQYSRLKPSHIFILLCRNLPELVLRLEPLGGWEDDWHSEAGVTRSYLPPCHNHPTLGQSCHKHPTLVQSWYNPATSMPQPPNSLMASPHSQGWKIPLKYSLSLYRHQKGCHPTLPQPAGIPKEGLEIGLANGYRGPMLLTGVAVSLE